MDAGSYTKFILALVFVLGLIGVLATLVRRYGIGLPQTPVRRRGQDKRLGLVEVMPLDAKRRLVLIKRDHTEHLVILGPTTETLIESNITPPSDGTEDFTEALEKMPNQELPLNTRPPL